MEWNPTTGFEIDAFLDKTFAPVDGFGTVGQTILNDRSDTFVIRLGLRNYGSAIVPNVPPLAQKKSIIPDNHLSLTVKHVVFFQRLPQQFATDTDSWSGSAMFQIKAELRFPDTLTQETSLAGQHLETATHSGLSYAEDNGLSITGRNLTENAYELNWSLPKSHWTKTEAAAFAEAARKALSIIFAQTIWAAKWNVTRGALQIYSVRKRKNIERLSHEFRPLIDLDFDGPKQRAFNKSAFIDLLKFFIKADSHADIAWRIFYQIADAARREDWHSRALALSITLEGALRTLDNHPFKDGDATWRRKESMLEFQKRYFTEKWTPACETALKTHTRLRHKNAHPDWLATPNGALSKDEMKKTIKDLTFLSRFYGYMILGLAGVKGCEPLFPVVTFNDGA